MMRYIDSDEGPYTFWAMEPNQRSRRARVYLITLGGGEEPIMAWLAAIADADEDPEVEALIHSMVDVNWRPDSRIEERLRDFQRRQRPAG